MGLFITLSAGITALAITVLVYVRRPPATLWPSLFLFTLTVTVWAFGELFTTFLTTDQRWYWTWVVIQYTGVQALPPVWWILTLQFARICGYRIRWAGPVVRYGPAAIVFLFWLAMITNPLHSLFMVAVVNEPNDYGPLWYGSAGVAYALIFSSIAVLTWLATRRLKRDHVVQVRLMLAGASLPLVSNFLYTTGLLDLGFDITVAAFSILALFFSFGIYRHRMFALSPFSLNRVIYDEPNALVITDREGRVCFVNAAAEALFWSSADLVNSPVFPVMDAVFEHPDHPGTAPGFQAICRPDQEQKSLVSGELLRLRGTDRYFVFQRTNLPGWVKREFGFAVRLIEVTDAQQTKTRLAEHAGAMEAILETVREGILVVDADGDMIFFNDIFRKLWNLPQHVVESRSDEEAIQHVLSQLVDPDSFVARIQELYASPQKPSDRDEIRRKDGRVYERSSRPLFNGEKTIGRVWTFRDASGDHGSSSARDALGT